MILAEIRRRFYDAGDAHAYVRSDDATYRMAYGRPMPASRLAERAKPDAATYAPAEQAALDLMSGRQRTLYLSLRAAAEQGNLAPTYASLEQICVGSGSWEPLNCALDGLEEMGAIRRIRGCRGNRTMYQLPLAGLETRRP